MTGGEIALLLIALVLMGGVAYWAVSPKAKAAPTSGDQQARDATQDVLAGRAPPPRDNDPRRGPSGQCIAPWHSVLQGDLSSRCDLPGGMTVISDGAGGWTGHTPGQTDVGLGKPFGFDSQGALIVHAPPGDSARGGR